MTTVIDPKYLKLCVYHGCHYFSKAPTKRQKLPTTRVCNLRACMIYSKNGQKKSLRKLKLNFPWEKLPITALVGGRCLLTHWYSVPTTRNINWILEPALNKITQVPRGSWFQKLQQWWKILSQCVFSRNLNPRHERFFGISFLQIVRCYPDIQV